VGEIEADGFNLDRRNPNRADDLAHRPPEELIAELIDSEREIMKLLNVIQAELAS
jgi:type I restriction enzyme M protein